MYPTCVYMKNIITCSNLATCSSMVLGQKITILIRISAADFFAVGHFAKPAVTVHRSSWELPDLLIAFGDLMPHLIVATDD